VERSVIPKDYKNHPKLYSAYFLTPQEYYLRLPQAVELYNSEIQTPKPKKNLANSQQLISIINQYKERIMTLE